MKLRTILIVLVLALVAYGVVELVVNAVVDPAVTPDLPEPEAGDDGNGGG